MSRAEFYRMTSAALRRVGDVCRSEPTRAAWAATVRELAHTYATTNQKFDPVRFLKDSGLE